MEENKDNSFSYGRQEYSHVNFDEFYAERVASFERERNLFDQYIRLVKPEHNEAHDLEWESRNLQEEARLAKQAVGSVEDKLKLVLKEIGSATRELQELQQAQILRKEQIGRLTLLARPVGKDTAYIYRDLFPVNHANSPAHNLSAKSKSAALKSAEKEQIEATNSLFKTIKTGEVVKLELRVHEETLRCTAHLRDLQCALRETEEERHASHVHHQLLREEDINSALNYWREVDRNEFQGFFAVSELLRLRYRILVAQRQEVEELERLQQDKETFVAKEEEAKHQLIEEMNSLQRSAQKELQDCQRSFEQQLADLDYKITHWREKERHLLSLKEKVHTSELKLHNTLTETKER